MNKKLTVEYNGSYNESFQTENNNDTIKTFIMTHEVCKNFIEQMKETYDKCKQIDEYKLFVDTNWESFYVEFKDTEDDITLHNPTIIQHDAITEDYCVYYTLIVEEN